MGPGLHRPSSWIQSTRPFSWSRVQAFHGQVVLHSSCSYTVGSPPHPLMPPCRDKHNLAVTDDWSRICVALFVFKATSLWICSKTLCFLSRLLSHLQRRTQILRKLDERTWRLLQEVRIIHENLLQEELWKMLIDTNFIPISHNRSMIKINDWVAFRNKTLVLKKIILKRTRVMDVFDHS